LNRGIEPIQLLKDLTTHFRNLLLVQAAGRNADPDLLSLPPDYYQQLSAQMALFPETEEIPQIIGRLASVERNVRHSSQPQLWLEVGLIELAYRYEIQLVKDLSERVSQLESRLAGGAVAPQASVSAARPPAPVQPRPQPAVSEPVASVPSAPPPATYAAPPAPVSAPVLSQPASVPIAPPAPQPSMAPPATAGSLDALYGQVCAAIPSLMFRALVQQQSFPISLEGDLFVVGCLGDANLATMKKADKFIHLQKAVDKVLGRPIRVELVLEKKKPEGASVPAIAAVAPPTIKEVVAASPVLPTLPAAVSTPAMPKSEAADKPPIPFAPAMPKLANTTPEKPLDFSAKPLSTPAAPLEAMPPMDFEDDAPPLEDDGIPDEDFDVPLPLHGSALPYSSDGEHELKEAKKHAVELMQGRILE
jgi:DNA polymerase-3 subunit gamma/tau